MCRALLPACCRTGEVKHEIATPFTQCGQSRCVCSWLQCDSYACGGCSRLRCAGGSYCGLQKLTMANAQAPPVDVDADADAAVTNAQVSQHAGGGGSGSGSDSGRGGSGSGSASGTGSGAGSGEDIAWRGATIMRSCAYGSCAFSAVIQYLAHALQAVPSFIRRAVTGACVCVAVCVCARARAYGALQ